jgi:hypothetical protein
MKIDRVLPNGPGHLVGRGSMVEKGGEFMDLTPLVFNVGVWRSFSQARAVKLQPTISDERCGS